MLEVLRAEHPGAVVSASAPQVLREYREYERSVTTLVDAAVKPKVGAYVTNIRTRLDEIAPGVPFYVMKSNGGVLSRRRGRAPADHHDAVRPGGRGPGRGADRRHGRLRPGAHLRRRRHLDRRHRGHRRRADAHHRGLGRRLPVEDPDDRRRHRRRGRRLDRLALARGHAQGRAEVGRRRPRPDAATRTAATSRPSPTRTSSSAGSRRTCWAGRSRCRSRRRPTAWPRLGAELDLALERTATGILEISAWNQANALRQVTVARGLDVRDFTLTTFGGSGSLLACRLMDILDLPRTLVPPNPGNVSAFGLLTVDVRNDYVQTVVVQARRPRPRPGAGGLRRPGGPGRGPPWTARASAATSSACSARRTCATSARRSRCACPVAGRRARRAPRPRTVAQAFHAAHRQLYGYDFADRPAPGRRVGEPAGRAGSGRSAVPTWWSCAAEDGGTDRAVTGSRRVFFDDWIDTPTVLPARPRPRRRRGRARRSSRSSARPSRCTPASPPPSTAYGNLLLTEGVGPMTPMATTARSTPTRSSSRSSPARWPRSRRRSRPRSGAPRARR